jgi:hypothetical protein
VHARYPDHDTVFTWAAPPGVGASLYRLLGTVGRRDSQECLRALNSAVLDYLVEQSSP